MAKEYIVWICVEEFDTVEECGEDIDLPFAAVRTFRGKRALQNSIDYATALQSHANSLIAWKGKGKRAND